MRVRGRAGRRWGGTLVECAVVGSLALMLLLGTVVVGVGVFRYQQVGDLAREGTRYAAVHGPAWVAANSGQSLPDASTIKSYLLTYAAGMDASKLSCSITWGTGVVTVSVTYTWAPEAYLGSSAVTLTSSSTNLVTN